MTDRIVVTGIRGLGYHGIFENEKKQGQEFLVDLDVETDFSRAVEQDNIEYSVNYAVLADIAYEFITGDPFELIESLADAIAIRIKQIPLVTAVQVTVHKPYAPIEVPFADVAVIRSLS